MAKFSHFSQTIYQQKYAHINGNNQKETWTQISKRVVNNVLSVVKVPKDIKKQIIQYIDELKFIPGGRYLYAAGLPYHQTQNCFLFKAQDSREGWADLLQKSALALMTGGGIGTDYSLVREEGRPIRKIKGFATGPVSLGKIVNEAGRYIMQGGSRRSAIWAGLRWDHPDIYKFINSKNWIKEVRELKRKDFSFPADLDMTNISVLLNDEFFEAYHDEKHIQHSLASSVYWATVERMLKTSEPGFSVDLGKNKHETLRNACCEITSSDDADVCNLGSINLGKIESLNEMKDVVECATIFLLAGTIYSDVPFAKVDEVRNKNRRIGLGLMGMHEFLLKRNQPYGINEELGKYLDIYSDNQKVTNEWANKWDISKSIKTRSIAPTGTIAIVAGTTTGIEPLFCSAYKRRYLKGKEWHYQYVIDNITEKMIEQYGLHPDDIEDAYSLSKEPQRRMEFQTWVQKHVDHAISSTMNIPAWGSVNNNKDKVRDWGNLFLNYLPELRGLTIYADGSRGGQPLQPIKYETAKKHIGEVFRESNDLCEITGAGSCGS